MPEQLDITLFRLSVASSFSLVSLQVAREMFQKGYFQLGQGEKAVVDQAAFALVSASFQGLTAENLQKMLGSQQANPVGFVPSTPSTTAPGQS